MGQVKRFCEKYDLTKEQFYGRQKISDDLDLDSLTCIPEGFNPNVEGNLYLGRLTSIPEGWTPNVGGSLCLGRNKYIGLNMSLKIKRLKL